MCSLFYFVGFLSDAIKSLSFDPTNKVKNSSDEQRQGVVSDFLPELTLETPDNELLSSSDKWLKEWNKWAEKEGLVKRQKRGEEYWVGKQDDKDRRYYEEVSPDNLIFESLETFLPIATKENPEPVVSSNINSEESLEYNSLIKDLLVWIADEIRLKLKIKRATRHWALSLIGVVKVAWDLEEKIPSVYVIRPQKMILDPNSTIEEGRYTGKFSGEFKQETADSLISRFPEKAEFISNFVEGKTGTTIQYVEWWTHDMVFWTLEREVLGKMKNPHWDYGEDLNETVDEMGQVIRQAIPASNHFLSPQMPYCFLSVFNLGKGPVDDTSFVEQNIPMQDEINKTNRQIRRNVAEMNGTVVVSSDVFNKDQSKALADAVRDGRPVLVPGSVNEAYKRDSAPGLPADVFNYRNDMRGELRGVFGVTGSSAQGIASEETVRGKIIVREQDSSRIGGGVSVYIEQLADEIFNWFVQMIYVYGEMGDLKRILGPEKAERFLELKSILGDISVQISVKEGSLIPQDPLTQRNEAIELFTAGALDPEELFKRLDFPDPVASARRLQAWKSGQLASDIEAAQQPNPLSQSQI